MVQQWRRVAVPPVTIVPVLLLLFHLDGGRPEIITDHDADSHRVGHAGEVGPVQAKVELALLPVDLQLLDVARAVLGTLVLPLVALFAALGRLARTCS